MGTQRGIAQLIREKQANYVLSLKKNQKRFYRCVERNFLRIDELSDASIVQRQTDKVTLGHGRLEKRTYTILPAMYFHKYKKHWRDLSAIIRVESTREKLEKTETAVRYYITSLPFSDVERMCQSVREH